MLLNFGYTEAGDLSRWSGSKNNISQGFKYDKVGVYNEAKAYEDAMIYRDATYEQNTGIFWVSCFTSRGYMTVYFEYKNDQIYVHCGCFSGTINEFTTKVNDTYGGTVHVTMYYRVIQLGEIGIGVQ